MTIEELREKLEEIERRGWGDWEAVHGEQGDALLEYINDDQVSKIYNRTTKWCA